MRIFAYVQMQPVGAGGGKVPSEINAFALAKSVV